MTGASRDPFTLWRQQQRDEEAAPEQPPQPAVELTPERLARLHLAVDDVLDAHGSGDEQQFADAVQRAVRIRDRLWHEQLAEHGVVPATPEGAAAVLNVAAAIIEALA